MELSERQQRWERLWQAIEDRTPALWGRSFLAALMRTTLPMPKPKAAAAVAAEGVVAQVPAGPPRLTLVEKEPEVPARRVN
jgi:trehalose-6-phosphate synthase